MIPKYLPDEIVKANVEYMKSLNECQRRIHLALLSLEYGRHGVTLVCSAFGVSKTTLYAGRKELKVSYIPGNEYVRRKVGGRRRILEQQLELKRQIISAVEDNTAGLPQDDQVRWLAISVTGLLSKLRERGIYTTRYIVEQVLDELGYRRRSFKKGLPMKTVEGRDEQFRKIEEARKDCAAKGIPVFSIDTKKKELIGRSTSGRLQGKNFKRSGQVLCQGKPKAYDHDFPTFADGQIVPYGIYDTQANNGYLVLGKSHDTSQFACDSFEQVWSKYLREQYPETDTIAILCDGGGSNSSSHKIVKHDFMELANRIGLNIIMMHFPPYCSKFKPIEHKLFAAIRRSWSGAPLLSVENAKERAESTTTTKGLSVHVDINDREYETKRKVGETYKDEVARRIVFDTKLPKWNYRILNS